MTRGQIISCVVIAAGVVAGFFLFIAPDWLYHPLGYCAGTPVQIRDCKGYNSYSGSFSDLTEVTDLAAVVAGFVSLWLHTRCDTPGCLHKGKYQTADGHHRQCRRCFPDVPNHRLSREEIHAAHHAAKHG